MSAKRISGACVGCRAKKQKCSGDRSGCAQCAAAGIECVWPEQRKRGPAKGYIEALEQRLHAAETLLLGILPHVDDTVLQEATAGGLRRMSRAASEGSGVDLEERRTSRSSPPTLNKRTGVEYWEIYGLDSVTNVRRWQQNCADHTSGQANPTRSQIPSQAQAGGTFQQYRGDDEMRSSVAATMAGMRHHTTSPGTPNSGSASSMMAVAASSRPMYESSMSPGRGVNLSQASSSTSLPTHLAQTQQQQQQQQQQPQAQHGHPPTQSQTQPLWYQHFQQQPSGNQHSMSMGMNMGVDQNYAQTWSNPQSSTTMDVDSNAMTTNDPHPQQQNQQGNHPGGLYQGDFSQNIFW